MPLKDAAALNQTPIKALVIGSQRATLCNLLDVDYDIMAYTCLLLFLKSLSI
jgi:hypothetical protein